MTPSEDGGARPRESSRERWTLGAEVRALLLFLSACMEFSPFETDLIRHERDLTDKQLARLASLPDPAGAFNFALVSDTHERLETLHALVDVFNARDDLAFVAHLGDMTNMGLRREFRGTLDQLEELQIPFVTAVGNHDALSHGRDIYRSMFGPFDYTFAYGGIRFVCVNANAREYPGEAVPDLEWLRHATAPQPDLTGVIVFSHQPLQQPEQLEVLADNGVLAAFGAHVHQFTSSLTEGVFFVTSGDGRDGDWVLVSVDGVQITVAACSGHECTPRPLP